VLVLKACRLRLEPSREDEEFLSSGCGALRFVWNWFLAQREAFYEASSPDHKVRISRDEQINQLPAMKEVFPWLASVPSQPLQQVLRTLDTAYQRFFDGVSDHPKFKKRGKVDPSLHFPVAPKLNGRCIYIPTWGWVKCRFSGRRPMWTMKSFTVKKVGRHWYATILEERNVIAPVHSKATVSVGLDAGVEESFAGSNGSFHNLRVPSEKELRKLTQLQQRLSRCVKGSKRWYRALARYNRYRLRLADCFYDSQHKLTTAIAKNHGIVAVEDLRLVGMTASARGSVEAPGRNVAQKSGLNRALLEQGIGETFRQLEYKLAWSGGTLLRVPPAGTSMTCSECGHKAHENRPERARFVCMACGHAAHADTNAACNIVRLGLAMLHNPSSPDGSYGVNGARAGVLPEVPLTHQRFSRRKAA